MKKTLLTIVAVLIIAGLSVSLIACKGKSATLGEMIDLSTIDYKSGKEVVGLDSVEVLNKALNYMKGSDNFAYTILFNFATEPALATQSNKEVVRKNGAKLLHEQVTIGTGLGESHLAALRLHEGDSHRVIQNDTSNKSDAKKRVPGFDSKDDSQIFNYDLSNIQPIALSGEVPKYDYCAEFDNYADFMYHKAADFIWYYNYSAKDLAQEHSAKVYLLDGFYYCDITIDTLNCIKKGNQSDVLKDIEYGIDMKVTGFVENTILRLKLEEVGGEYRFVATQLTEYYKSSMAKAKQTSQRKFSYKSADYTVTDSLTKAFD